MRKPFNLGATLSRDFQPIGSIWRDTEGTVLRIAHENPGYRLLLWPLLGSLAYSWLFDVTGVYAAYDDLDFELDFAGLVWGSLLTLGPVLEIPQLFVFAWLLRVVGGQLGGVGPSSALQVVVAWSNVPLVALVAAQLLLWPLAALWTTVLGPVFAPFAPGGDLLGHYPIVAGTLACAELAAVAASTIILVRGVAAVHRLGLSKAICVVLICWLGLLALVSVVLAGFVDDQWLRVLLFGPLLV